STPDVLIRLERGLLDPHPAPPRRGSPGPARGGANGGVGVGVMAKQGACRMMPALISDPMLRFRRAQSRAVPRVLIAQDNGAARQRLAAALRRDGFAIVELDSAARLVTYLIAARENAAEAGVSAVIAELNLSDQAVSDLLACLRLRDFHTPMILLSAG